ncbi:MAG: DUF2169 domain-containing protein, partial [Myxococcales bacterium]|nr:DUF2169 domain-containing protein [Myxococcales bacterium]
KPRCDVLLHGSCHAPGGRKTQACEVEVAVGPWRKRLRVLGDRAWTGGLAGARLSEPVAFECMEISYARAYGGTQVNPRDPSQVELLRENPVGVGFYPYSRGAGLDGLLGPNCEAIGDRVTSPWGRHQPAAFGPVGRSWLPRLPLAGTYDQSWLDQQFPFLPRDFRHDYFQSAPPDQQVSPPSGGELCVLINLTPEGRTSFILPSTQMPVVFVHDDGRVETQAIMDTLVIDAHHRRVTLTWRASLALHRSLAEVRELVFGPMTPGWQRAQARGKVYYRSLSELCLATARARLGPD